MTFASIRRRYASVQRYPAELYDRSKFWIKANFKVIKIFSKCEVKCLFPLWKVFSWYNRWNTSKYWGNPPDFMTELNINQRIVLNYWHKAGQLGTVWVNSEKFNESNLYRRPSAETKRVRNLFRDINNGRCRPGPIRVVINLNPNRYHMR